MATEIRDRLSIHHFFPQFSWFRSFISDSSLLESCPTWALARMTTLQFIRQLSESRSLLFVWSAFQTEPGKLSTPQQAEHQILHKTWKWIRAMREGSHLLPQVPAKTRSYGGQRKQRAVAKPTLHGLPSSATCGLPIFLSPRPLSSHPDRPNNQGKCWSCLSGNRRMSSTPRHVHHTVTDTIFRPRGSYRAKADNLSEPTGFAPGFLTRTATLLNVRSAAHHLLLRQPLSLGSF